jgi:thiosulfate reductase cytochrome b subunit
MTALPDAKWKGRRVQSLTIRLNHWINVLLIVIFLLSGEWRRRLFLTRRDVRNALLMFTYYLRILRTHPAEDFYNGLQRFAYTFVLILITIQVLSGLAIYKPVQLH